MRINEKILVLSEEEVMKLLTPEDAIIAAEDTFYRIGCGDITVGTMALMYADAEKKNNFHAMPAILHHRNAAGVKWISTFGKPLEGYPFSHGTVVMLSDTRTGSPIALVAATGITAMRTAGGHGVVQAKHLCLPEPKVLSVCGCGAQAKAGIRGFLETFPSIERVQIYSRSKEPMEEVKRLYKERAEVVICDAPEQAVNGSKLILMASGAQETLVKLEMLAPGTTVIGIEGFRDLDPQIGKSADKWYLGYRIPDMHILQSPKLNPGGLLSIGDVYGDMTELLTGKVKGREREDEIIVSTHMGMGAHDVNCALTAYERALTCGIGTQIEL